MIFTKQKHRTDCGIASFSMLVNIPYAKALKALHPSRKKGEQYGTRVVDFIKGFKRLGYKSNWKLATTRVRLLDIKRNVLVILHHGSNSYHAIVWNAKEQAIYDPALNMIAYFGKNRIATPNGKYKSQSVRCFYEKILFGYITFRRA